MIVNLRRFFVLLLREHMYQESLYQNHTSFIPVCQAESELSSTVFLSGCVRFNFLINSIEQKGVKMERLFKIIISFVLYGAKYYSS